MAVKTTENLDADTLGRVNVAAELDEAQAFLRVVSRADFFSGYSLAEVLQEQIALIGEDKMEEPYQTKLRQLERFRMHALQAIEQARLYAKEPKDI